MSNVVCEKGTVMFRPRCVKVDTEILRNLIVHRVSGELFAINAVLSSHVIVNIELK